MLHCRQEEPAPFGHGRQFPEDLSSAAGLHPAFVSTIRLRSMSREPKTRFEAICNREHALSREPTENTHHERWHSAGSGRASSCLSVICSFFMLSIHTVSLCLPFCNQLGFAGRALPAQTP